jgi:hypothetical protein
VGGLALALATLQLACKGRQAVQPSDSAAGVPLFLPVRSCVLNRYAGNQHSSETAGAHLQSRILMYQMYLARSTQA